MSSGLESALSVRWAFGFQHSVRNGVQNLTTRERSAIFFLSSHSGSSTLSQTTHTPAQVKPNHAHDVVERVFYYVLPQV